MLLHILGIFLIYFWDIVGIVLGYYFDIFGILLGYVGDICGICLGYAWDNFGICLGYFWDICCVCFGYFGEMFGICFRYVWYICLICCIFNGWAWYIIHTGFIPLVKRINQTKKTQKEEGRVKFEMLVANQIEKSCLTKSCYYRMSHAVTWCWHFVGNMLQRCRFCG